jgi:hypothetical protein
VTAQYIRPAPHDAVGFGGIRHATSDLGNASAAQLCAADYRFWQLDHYDGLTDIIVAPFYPHLDALYPGSKFALTLRDKASWLKSCRNHWKDRPAFYDDSKSQTHMRMRRLLRAATYGCYEFDEARFAWVYDEHVRRVREHFRDRPDQLLELNVVGGDGFRPLANFLGVPVPSEPFPHKGGVLSKDLAELEVLD